MPYLHPFDVLDRAEADAEGAGSAVDRVEVARGDAWQVEVLARQLAAAARDRHPWDAPAGLEPGGHGDGGDGRDGGDGGLGDADGERREVGLQRSADRLLAQIQQLEAERAGLDGRIVDAYAGFRAVVGRLLDARTRRLGITQRAAERAVEVDVATVEEITTATAVPAGRAAARVRLAADPARYAGLRARLAVGSLSLLHAGLIAAEVAAVAVAEGWDEAVHDEMVELVAGRVLAPLRGGAAPTHAQIRSRLTRVLRSLADPAAALARRARARARRRLSAQLSEDGMGELVLVAPAEVVVAVMDRVQDLARSLRQGGDPRTLDQLRADLATQALLAHRYGPCQTHTCNADASHAHEAADAGEAAADAAGNAAGNAAGDAAGAASAAAGPDTADGDGFGVVAGGGSGGRCGCAPTVPAATAWIVVPFEVAAGLSDAACELPGHGWVTADHARAIITAPGSVWRWLAVDELTGQALRLGTDRYRPTPAMTEQVRALDGHCRAPGCTIPARRCDVDHHTPWPDGPTALWNLGPLDRRRHHQPKTLGLTHCQPVGPQHERALRWCTLTGRDYITYPKSWTEALHDPTPPASPHPPAKPRHEPPPF